MKSRNLIICVCFLLCISVFQLHGQSSGTKSVQVWVTGSYWTPVYCDGDFTDYIIGDVTIHYIDHYADGKWKWEIAQMKGTGEGLYGETFTVKEIDKLSSADGILTWHFNLKGDMGNSYIASMSYSYITGEFKVEKAVCHQ